MKLTTTFARPIMYGKSPYVREVAMATTAMGGKSSRLDLRMSDDQKSTINKAAELCGMSLSQWSLDRLMRSARNDILDASTMRLSTEAFDRFVNELEQPRNRDFDEFLKEKTIWE